MLDPKFIRQNKDKVKAAVDDRGYRFDLDRFLQVDAQRLACLAKAEELAALQNRLAREVQDLIKQKKDPKDKIAESKDNKLKIEKEKEAFALGARMVDAIRAARSKDISMAS